MGAFRLSNDKLVSFVNLVDIVLARAPFVHRIGRQAVLLLLPVLKKHLCPEPEYELYFRNSVKDSSFKLFRSDLDLTLVVPDATSRTKFAEILDRYKKLHRWFLPLGEIEIYTKTEYKIKTALEERHGKILRTIRLLRKIRNEINFLKAPMHSYHRRKAENAISKIITELTGKNASAGFGKTITTVLRDSSSNFLDHPFIPPAEIHGESGFLGWSLSSSKEVDLNTIALEPKVCFAFASLLPDADFGFDPWMESIKGYRELDFVKERVLAIATMEYILVRAVTRMSLQEQNSNDWFLRLERLIENYDPQVLMTLKQGNLTER